MKRTSMSGLLRANVGKKDAKQQRKEGRIPCVVYGGKEELHITLSEKDLTKIVFSAYPYLVDLDVEGKKLQAVIQEVQYHPVTDNILHVDFLECFADKPIKVSVPVSLTGNSPGVLKGGKLRKRFRKLLVKGLINDIPEVITIDISKLNINDSIRVSEVKVDNLELLDKKSAQVVSVSVTRVVEETPEGAEHEDEAESEGGDAPAEEHKE